MDQSFCQALKCNLEHVYKYNFRFCNDFSSERNNSIFEKYSDIKLIDYIGFIHSQAACFSPSRPLLNLKACSVLWFSKLTLLTLQQLYSALSLSLLSQSVILSGTSKRGSLFVVSPSAGVPSLLRLI